MSSLSFSQMINFQLEFLHSWSQPEKKKKQLNNNNYGKCQENASATGVLGKELRKHFFHYYFWGFIYLFLNNVIS